MPAVLYELKDEHFALKAAHPRLSEAANAKKRDLKTCFVTTVVTPDASSAGARKKEGAAASTSQGRPPLAKPRVPEVEQGFGSSPPRVALLTMDPTGLASGQSSVDTYYKSMMGRVFEAPMNAMGFDIPPRPLEVIQPRLELSDLFDLVSEIAHFVAIGRLHGSDRRLREVGWEIAKGTGTRGNDCSQTLGQLCNGAWGPKRLRSTPESAVESSPCFSVDNQAETRMKSTIKDFSDHATTAHAIRVKARNYARERGFDVSANLLAQLDEVRGSSSSLMSREEKSIEYPDNASDIFDDDGGAVASQVATTRTRIQASAVADLKSFTGRVQDEEKA